MTIPLNIPTTFSITAMVGSITAATVIDNNTLIPVSAVCGLIVGVFVIGRKFQNVLDRLDSVDRQGQELNRKVDGLKTQINSLPCRPLNHSHGQSCPENRVA